MTSLQKITTHYAEDRAAGKAQVLLIHDLRASSLMLAI